MNRGTYSHQSPSALDVRDPCSEFYQGPHHGKHWYLWHPDDIGTAKPMNEVAWFKAFQPLLLRVVNSGYGRQLMGIDADLPVIQHIAKNAIHCYLGEGKWWAEFRVGAKWANVIRYRWPEFKRYARFFYDMPNFFTLLNLDGKLVPAHATSTSYPDPDSETSSFDGRAEYYDTGGIDWADMRTATSSIFIDDDNASYNHFIQVDGITNKWKTCTRSFHLFDTSALGSSATVSAAVWSFVIADLAIYNQLAEGLLWGPYEGTTASVTAQTASDYANSNGGAKWATTVVPVRNSTMSYTFNSTGIAGVSLTAATKVCLRDGYDGDDSEYTWASEPKTQGAQWIAADTGGTSSDPKLVVTYSVVTSDIEAMNGIALADIEAVNGITAANGEAINGVDF